MLRDEKDHLEWVHDWLKPRPEAPALLKKYIEIDQAVYQRLLPFLDHLWDIPGLGDELSPHDVDLVAPASRLPSTTASAMPALR
jgi:hypothetical protein